MSETKPVCVSDYERLAEGVLEAGPLGYYAGGADDESTLRDNVEAFSRWQLRPRMLVDVGDVSTATTALGTAISMPVIVAPTAFHKICHPDGEQGTARAAAAAGTLMCVSTLANTPPAEVAAAAPDAPRWFQLYCFRDDAVTKALVDEASAAGYKAIVLTVDAPVPGRRERDFRTGFSISADVPSLTAALGRSEGVTVKEMFEQVSPSLTWRDLERVAAWSDLPLILKGVFTKEDAQLAVDHGAAAVVVSNHGGRQLDGVSASIDALPEVVEAVDGAIEVYMDGGIRRGTDVAKALALGARAVLIGRAVLWGLAGGGEQGVAHVLEMFRDEVWRAQALLGCPTPHDIGAAHVQRAAR